MRRRQSLLLIVSLLVIGLIAVCAAYQSSWSGAEFHPGTPVGFTPIPLTEPFVLTRGGIPVDPFNPIVERSLPSYANPGAAGFVDYATIHVTPPVPPARPTYDPLYPGNYPLGIECQEYLDTIWGTEPAGGGACTTEPCSTSNINWSLYTTCVNDSAAHTVKYGDGSTGGQPVVLTIPGRWLEEGPPKIDGTPDPDAGKSSKPWIPNYAPTWMKSLGFTQSFERATGVWYTGTNYDNVSFLNRMKQMVTEAGAQFDDDANVVAVRINTGLVGETQPVKCMSMYGDTGCTNDKTLRTTHENLVASCTSYLAFIDALARAAVAAFPHKAVYMEAGPAACGGPYPNDNYETRKYLWEDATVGWGTGANPVTVGYSYNAIAPDHANADGNGEDWSKYLFVRFAKTGQTYASPMPVLPEYQFNRGDYRSYGDDFATNVWTAYASAGAGANGTMPFNSWSNNFSDLYWNVVDTKFGSQPNRGWIVFREREWPTYRMDYVNNVYYGGFREDYQDKLKILTPTAYPQYCGSSVKNAAATSVAGMTNPTPVYKPCGNNANALPTVKATTMATPGADATSQYNILQRVASRQARQIPASGVMGIAADNTWARYGTVVTATISLTYLDNGTDDFVVKTSKSPVDSHTVDKGVGGTITGLWKTATWTVASTIISNTISVASRGNAIIEIDAGASTPLYLHTLEIYITSAAGATNTPTFTPTFTPTLTRTPTPSRTPTPTATLTPVYTGGIRFNEVNSSEGGDWTLSGDVNEADRYFEIINWNSAAQSVAGWSVSNGTQSYLFGSGSSLNGYGYKVVLAEDGIAIPDSGTLTLKNAQLTPVATVVYVQATPGLCYAAHPNGSSTWLNNQPCSPGQANP